MIGGDQSAREGGQDEGVARQEETQYRKSQPPGADPSGIAGLETCSTEGWVSGDKAQVCFIA